MNLLRPLRFAVYLLALTLAALIGAGMLGSLHPALDALSNLRAHLAILLAMASLAAAFSRAKAATLPGFAIAAVALWTSLSGMPIAGERETTAPEGKIKRLVAFNLSSTNAEPRLALRALRESDADFLALSEATASWRKTLEALNDVWPHAVHCARWKLTLLSREAFASGGGLCERRAPLALGEAIIDGKRVVLGVAHLRRPWPASGPLQFVEAAEALKRAEPNVLIAGDFNAATWSHSVQSLAASAEMKIVNGIGPTWIHQSLNPNLAKWLGLPIDNAMFRGNIRIIRAETLEPAGSDHLPVQIDFAVR